ncbi:histone deacetylase family protein [Rhodobacteraceae bacterium DSL-40]|uniref:histone deacetylase family protein n=1 Tax=Amaricoccus sp. B4 TaxID=3368557 RepID=UPI000DAC099B
MRAIHDPRQSRHDPKHCLISGKVKPNREQPERAARLLAGARAAGASIEPPRDAGLAPIAAIHSPEYLTFLQTIHARWQALEDASEEVIPNVHPARRDADSYPASPVGQAGWHMADTACPIAAHTWDSAYWSAQTALSAADLVAGGARAVYALCRPPGHHAFGDLAGGFCFLNNSAIAAERLCAAGLRPAILDIDVHHGNGTQGIFYARRDVLTVSIHADPAGFYPFFWGHAAERGKGAGQGYNLNLPLPRGTGDAPWLETLGVALARISAFAPDVLVLALGLDAHEADPYQGLAVTTPGFTRIAARIAGLGLPTVIVQEGGYLSEHLGPNLTAFLGGFEAG